MVNHRFRLWNLWTYNCFILIDFQVLFKIHRIPLFVLISTQLLQPCYKGTGVKRAFFLLLRRFRCGFFISLVVVDKLRGNFILNRFKIL